METLYNITLTVAEIQYLGAVLSEQPYKFAKPLIDNLQAQADNQEPSIADCD